jgi:hypothetical protein
MTKCNCGGKTITVKEKKPTPKRVTPKKVAPKKGVTNLKRSKRLSRQATKKASAKAKGCKCS